MAAGSTYELYNIKNDPGQLDNLLYGAPAAEVKKEWSRLHDLMTARFVETGNLPDSFTWPLRPMGALTTATRKQYPARARVVASLYEEEGRP